MFNNIRASDRMRKKIKNFAEVFGNIMWKNVFIMWKKRLDYAEI